MLAPTEYLARHNKVAKYIHWVICRYLGVSTEERWYEHQPKANIKREGITVMWDSPIQTDRTIPANRPDIVIYDKKKQMCLLIEITVPDDGNIITKENEKLNKYKDLEIEIQRMWHTKAKTVPIVIGALGVIRKGIEKYLEQIPGQPDLRELQKIAIMGTAHILRKILT